MIARLAALSASRYHGAHRRVCRGCGRHCRSRYASCSFRTHLKRPRLEKVRKSVRRTSRATTIDEVAALAKVSPMTVSRVVNNNGSVR
ncbi:LacI family DNA-binding transcriptional regulator, partial [Xanthomonas codiaei]